MMLPNCRIEKSRLRSKNVFLELDLFRKQLRETLGPAFHKEREVQERSLDDNAGMRGGKE